MTFTDEERATVIAALRLLQGDLWSRYRRGVPPVRRELQMLFAEHPPLTSDAINALCREIESDDHQPTHNF